MDTLQLFASGATKAPEYLKNKANSRDFALYMLGFLGEDHPELSNLICACLSRDPGSRPINPADDF